MSSKHVVLHTINLWGHMKPLLGFAAHILEERPQVTFTVLTSAVLYGKCLEEIARIGASAERFHVVDFAGIPEDPMPTTPMSGFEDVFRNLWDAKPVVCRSSGQAVEALSAPIAIILDPFTYWAFDAVRKIAGDKCSIAAWTCCAASILHYGVNMGDFRAALQSRLASGMDVLQASREVWMPHTGAVVEIPGMPAMTMYDYEWSPQEDNLPHAMMTQHVYPSMMAADATIVVAIRELEEAGTQSLRDHLGTLGKTMAFVGPISWPDAHSADAKTGAPAEDAVVSFLDRMHAARGPQSVIYISFGTAFWPVDPDRLWAFLEELAAAGTPFVLAHAAPQAVVPAERRAAFLATGRALLVPWAPQEAILSHPATRAFVTHGGWNSVQETLAARITPILWPAFADQPGNAALLTLVHQAGFELLAVRTGAGASGAPYRCRDGPAPEFTVDGVRKETRALLKQLDGPEGRRARENVGRLAAAVDRAWGPEGAAREEMLGFLKMYVD